MGKCYRKANKELQKELDKQLEIIYPTAVIVLWTEYGWRHKRIARRLQTSQDIWQECASYGTQKSMMQMLEDETGIELRMKGYDKSYHEVSFLDASKWDGHIPDLAEATYIRQAQKKWIAPQLLSCFCLTMYRDEGFGAQRLSELIQRIDNYRFSHGNDPKWYMTEMEKVTGITKGDMYGT